MAEYVVVSARQLIPIGDLDVARAAPLTDPARSRTLRRGHSTRPPSKRDMRDHRGWRPRTHDGADPRGDNRIARRGYRGA
jgi:hypothetical protein